jgi:hypothetical protein
MTAAEIVGLLMKALLGVSVLGVIGKLGWPRSRLFRSHRHDHEQEVARANKLTTASW